MTPEDARFERAPQWQETQRPVYRRLRGYAFDPSFSMKLDTAVINETIYAVPWEDAADGATPGKQVDGLSPGPIGEYLEVVDFDPASGCFYAPVDLNDPYLLAQDGLAPSEGNPQFHQQMVYAVAMTTIRHFERALGRRALWSEREVTTGGARRFEYVQRLRIYPHALREPNAYYSPAKKALLFGYFPATADAPGKVLPGGLVFTCLSHDIVAHETTHALLDGMHARFIEPSHADGLAFHEAFADVVALFQHFTKPDVLRHQVAKTRGNLASQNLLGELAQQFGEAIGSYGALRSALGRHNPDTGAWEALTPDPAAYLTTTEPHARGAILVAALFDAFLAIYRQRVADLLRIATSGTGVLPEGDLHPDLVNRLAGEASKSALHVLTIAIRALDYCPPVDITFGDYLRAIITADADVVPDDDMGYRLALVEAFRRRGIYPRDVRSLSVESLKWPEVERSQDFFAPLAEQLKRAMGEFVSLASRRDVYEQTRSLSKGLHDWIALEGRHALREFGEIAGLKFDMDGTPGLRPNPDASGAARFQVQSVRPARRVGPDGDSLNQLIVTMMQTRDIEVDGPGRRPFRFKFRGGCTLVLDLDTMRLRYAIAKGIGDEERLARQTRFRENRMIEGSPAATYFRHFDADAEPLAVLHRTRDYGEP
ncbi:MAG: hypothetical protein IPM79_15910 [Polyangiaceae bacterium]|jgi:hypothetical protein|nr:hypothetical protein [Polyangiaceae bacterium]MBK8939066.1 hypothetical protein [Polyangiaceae bacterium]